MSLWQLVHLSTLMYNHQKGISLTIPADLFNDLGDINNQKSKKEKIAFFPYVLLLLDLTLHISYHRVI